MIRKIARLGLRGIALLVMLGLVSSPAQATNYWKNSVLTGNWSNGNNWSSTSAAGVDNGGPPAMNEAVNIVFTTGTAHDVTYDVAAPSLGLLSIDLTGPGTTTATLMMPGMNDLTTTGIAVGGYSGTGATGGRGALNQSGGTVITGSSRDLIMGLGAGSTGVYTLSGGAVVNNFHEYIGFSGTGTFNHGGGSNTVNASTAGFFSVGHNGGSTGTYNLSGTGTLSTATDQYIGGSGTGTFNQTGGTNTITSGKNLVLSANSGGAGTYRLSAGSLNVTTGREFIGASGDSIFTQSGGTNTAGSLEVRFGTYNLTGGALSSVDSEFVLYESVFNHTGGTNTIAGRLYVGYFGGFNSNAYNLGGTGLLSTVDEFIGYQGEGTLDQTGGTHTVTGNLRIGDDELDSYGAYNLSAGQAFIGGVLTLGGSAGSTGRLTVTGAGVITVGGTLRIYEANPDNYHGYIGLNGGTINAAALDFGGKPSLLSWADGTLNLTQSVTWDSSAAVTSTSAAFGSTLALNSNRTLIVTGNETLGGAGTFGLILDVGGTHIVTGSTMIAANGSLNLNGGTLNTGSLVINGAFTFNRGTLGITGLTGMGVGPSGPLGSTLLINAEQSLHVTNTLTVSSGAYLAVAGGLSAGNLVNNGNLVVINTAIDGPIVNNNAVTVVGTVDFNGQVSGPGDFFGPGTVHFNGGLAPGASPAEVGFEGSLTLADANTLFIEVGGVTPGSQYDRLTIIGSASLDGTLNVSLINGFTPNAGQQFTILTAGSIVNNGFVLAGSAASSFNLVVNSTSVLLQAIGLAGDYNQNGSVDAADYVLWRKNNNTAVTLPNDSTPGTSPADYDVWRSHFGQPPGSGSAASVHAAVPEPATFWLLMFGVAGWCLRRHRAA